MVGIEPTTFPLPRERSTTELHRHQHRRFFHFSRLKRKSQQKSAFYEALFSQTQGPKNENFLIFPPKSKEYFLSNLRSSSIMMAGET